MTVLTNIAGVVLVLALFFALFSFWTTTKRK